MMNIISRKELTVRDPVCGIWMEPEDAEDVELYEDKILYFCTTSCKKDFLINPDQYLIQKKEPNNEQFEL